MNPLLDHPPLLSLVLLFLFAFMVELGFRVSEATAVSRDESRREQITASRDALGVLLSLLLGFTLAMALPRYDLRRQLVLEEANSIGTASLRSDLLPAPGRENVRRLLALYGKTRLDYSLAGSSAADLREPLSRGKQLQAELWNEGAAAARVSPSPLVALFLQSVNDVIDVSEKRVAALENRIPQTIWIMLVAIGVLTCFLFGLAARRRFWLVSLITPLMLAIVFGLIADLDSPRNGFLRTDLRSLERLERDLSVVPGGPER